MIKDIIKCKNTKESNVIYKITLTNNNGDMFHYIGLTSRPLKMRNNEHFYNKKDIIRQTIDTYNINNIKVDILKKLNDKKQLNKQETLEIARYIKNYGKDNNKNNHLINIDLKGLEKKTLKEIKQFVSTCE